MGQPTIEELVDDIFKKAKGMKPMDMLVIDAFGEPIFNEKYEKAIARMSQDPNRKYLIPIVHLAHKYLVLKQKIKEMEAGK